MEEGVGVALLCTVFEAWMGITYLLLWMGLLSCYPMSLPAAVISTVFVLETPSSYKSLPMPSSYHLVNDHIGRKIGL
jgi:hypothetical protein